MPPMGKKSSVLSREKSALNKMPYDTMMAFGFTHYTKLKFGEISQPTYIHAYMHKINMMMKMIMKKDENVFSTFLDVKMHEKTVKEND